MTATCAQARALELFDSYSSFPLRKRRRLLSQLQSSDPGVYELLSAMLAVMSREETALDVPLDRLLLDGAEDAAAVHGHELLQGQVFEKWRIDRQVGHGGMGTVYRAHRNDGQYEQHVALKCIRADLTSSSSLEAFRKERALLAQLAHPGIANLMDGGLIRKGCHGWSWS